MRRNRIDLELLIVLDAIYAEGGITKASKRLNVTQPAISHALRRLRQVFADPLFVRDGRAITPTPLTRNLIGPLREALRGLEVVLNGAEHFDPNTSTARFAIAVRDVLEARVLPGLIAQTTRSAPHVEIVTVHALRRDLEAELAAGTVDIALDVLLPLSASIHHQRIAADRLMVMVREQHPLLTSPFTLEAYLDEDHIQVSARRSGLSIEDMALRRLDRQRRVRLRCQHYFTACRVLGETDLVLTMPSGYAQILGRQFGHRLLPFPIDVPPIDLFLYWHSNADGDRATQWLREQLVLSLSSYSCDVG
jgi:DNA-binding transcriptional LysR family regulator